MKSSLCINQEMSVLDYVNEESSTHLCILELIYIERDDSDMN